MWWIWLIVVIVLLVVAAVVVVVGRQRGWFDRFKKDLEEPMFSRM